MKIAIVKLDMMFQAGGQRQVYELSRHLKRSGHQVTIYTAELNPAYFGEISAGLDIRVINAGEPLSGFLDGKTLFRLITKKIRQNNVLRNAMDKISDSIDIDTEVVNCHDNSYRVGYSFKKRNHSVKVVWTMNDPPLLFVPKGKIVVDAINRLYLWLRNRFEMRILKSVDMVAALDSYNKQWADERMLPSRIVWSGLNFNDFYSSIKRISGQSLQVMCLGALSQSRRFEDAIEAVALLRDKKFSVRLLIATKDISYENVYRKKLEDLVMQRSVADRVSINFNGLSESDLRKAYRSSDVFVLPAYLPPPRNGYAWGLSAFEATAAGLVLVVCKTSGAADALVDGKSCLTIKPCSPTDIAAKLEFLLKNPIVAEHIAREGQKFTKENISWDRYSDAMLSLFGAGGLGNSKPTP